VNEKGHFRGADKLKDKVALITGGDSGIGRSVAVHMAREGAEIAIVYLEEDDDAADTAKYVEAEGRRCLTIRGNVSKEEFCKNAVGKVDASINGCVRLIGRLIGFDVGFCLRKGAWATFFAASGGVEGAMPWRCVSGTAIV
jgi:NAD(P)-dependent dehydrogenase (short-subunit alcohol dehydrogenase family)